MNLKNIFSSFKSKFGGLFKKNKKLFFLCLAVIVIVAFVFFTPKSQENDDSKNESLSSFQAVADSYETRVEQKIEEILLSISEVQSAKVMVVCDTTEVVDFLKNKTETTSGSGESQSKTITEEVVFEKNGSVSSPIIISKNMPKVVGVLIVINEVSPSTKLAITKSVSSVLNIDESCISILQGR